MDVTVNNIYNASYYDSIGGVSVPDNQVFYKLQFNRNCPTNDTIITLFGIRPCSGNFMSVQELYQNLGVTGV